MWFTEYWSGLFSNDKEKSAFGLRKEMDRVLPGNRKKMFRKGWTFENIIQIQNSFAAKGKVIKILKDSLDSIPSPSPSVKIQTIGGKVCFRCKGKILLGIVNKL